MLGSVELWGLLAVILILFGLPRLQRKLEQRVDEEKLGRETLARLAQRTTVSVMTEGLPVDILAEFTKVRQLRTERFELHRSEEAGINAVALPGGIIILTDGLLALFGAGGMSQDELAAVLAHEVGHIELGHARAADVRETMSRWATMALPRAGVGAAMLMAMKAGVGAMKKRVSRDSELEADAWAADLLAATPYADDALETFLGKTAAWSHGGGLWSTHPSAEDRVGALRSRAAD